MVASAHDSDSDLPTGSKRSRTIFEKDFTNRKFIPEELYGPDVNLDKIEFYDVNSPGPWVTVGCYRMEPCRGCGWYDGHSDCIFIAIDGACRNNGQPNAQAAMGVYFHYGSEMNVAKRIEISPTSQRAELFAAIEALAKTKEIYRNKLMKKLDSVVVKTDSAYLYDWITRHIIKWRRNNYTNARGLPLVNAGLFRRLDEKINDLNALNIGVSFWQVPREHNRPADALANAALDGGFADDYELMEAMFEGGRPPAAYTTRS